MSASESDDSIYFQSVYAPCQSATVASGCVSVRIWRRDKHHDLGVTIQYIAIL